MKNETRNFLRGMLADRMNWLTSQLAKPGLTAGQDSLVLELRHSVEAMAELCQPVISAEPGGLARVALEEVIQAAPALAEVDRLFQLGTSKNSPSHKAIRRLMAVASDPSQQQQPTPPADQPAAA